MDADSDSEDEYSAQKSTSNSKEASPEIPSHPSLHSFDVVNCDEVQAIVSMLLFVKGIVPAGRH